MRSDRRRRRPDSLRIQLGCERLEVRETPAAGGLDPTFGAGGRLADARIRGDLRAVALQPDGKLVAAGIVRTNSFTTAAVVARYNVNGTPDTTFDRDGLLSISFGNLHGTAAAVVVQSDGKILVAGDDGGDGVRVVRLNSSGTYDNTFDGDGRAFVTFAGLGVTVTGLALQGDGKVVVVGRGIPRNGAPGQAVLARLNRTGTLDTTFDGDGRVTANWGTSSLSADAVTVQPDGKIVVAGSVRTGTTAALVALRFSSIGRLDSTFGTGGGARTAFRFAAGIGAEVALQTDGKILIGGGSSVLRFNRDGSPDIRFGSSGVAETTINSVAGMVVQTDGTIYVTGSSSLGTNPTNVALARLTSAGVLDRTFDGDGRAVADVGGRDTAHALVLTNGKAVVAATTISSSGVASGALVRLLTTNTPPVTTPGRSSTSLSVSASTITVGQSVTLTAIVSGASTGTVTFRNGSTILGTVGLSGGRAAFTTRTLAVGTHSLSAVYNGTSGVTGSTSAAMSVTVRAATSKSTSTSLTASANSVAGRPITLTAVVTVTGGGTATGTVTFRNGTTVLGSASVIGGRATLTTSALPAGSHRITASYGGASGLIGSTSAVLLLSVAPAVGKAATQTSLTALVGFSVYGQQVTFTATVRSIQVGAPTPTGTVTFKEGSVIVGTVPLVGGTAKLPLSALRVGAHALTAVYNGDTRSAASTSAARPLTVNQARTAVAFTLTSLTVAAGSTLTLRATVRAIAPSTAVPTGRFTFRADNIELGTVTLDRNGQATLTIVNRLAVKQHWITAGYFGNESFLPDGGGDLLTVR